MPITSKCFKLVVCTYAVPEFLLYFCFEGIPIRILTLYFQNCSCQGLVTSVMIIQWSVLNSHLSLPLDSSWQLSLSPLWNISFCFQHISASLIVASSFLCWFLLISWEVLEPRSSLYYICLLPLVILSGIITLNNCVLWWLPNVFVNAGLFTWTPD